VEKKDVVWIISLNRPEVRNAVNPPTATALYNQFLEFEKDPSARVAILCGKNDTFCAGFDLKHVAKATDSSVPYEPPLIEGERGPMGPTRMLLSKPVIAAVSGFAVAGGLELSLWCDLRVCSEDAVFGVFCRRWGVPLIDGGTVRLPQIIGTGRALEMILTGRAVNAQEALSWGLVNQVVPKSELLLHAEKLAREIAKHPQLCMKSDRQSMYRCLVKPLNEALALEAALGVEAIEKEAVYGAQRFVGGLGRHGQSVSHSQQVHLTSKL